MLSRVPAHHSTPLCWHPQDTRYDGGRMRGVPYPGSVLSDRYRILEILEEGEMSVVARGERLPDGTLVEVLCGQPAQKCGMRSITAVVRARRASCSASRRKAASTWGSDVHAAIRAPIKRASKVALNSLYSGTSGAPCSSLLPITRGRRAAARS